MKVWHNGKSLEIKRGEWISTPNGDYKFTGRKHFDLFEVREYRYSDRSGNLYPVKGQTGLYCWTRGEMFEAVYRSRRGY